MTELDRALSEVEFIQAQLAASTRFRGFAPHAVAATGVLAIVTAAVQTVWPGSSGAAGSGFVITWAAVALLSASLIGIEAYGRSSRLHGSMADAMLAGTLRLLLPFGVAGAAITIVIVQVAPGAVWMLPGLWQILIALIGFSALATLPPAIVWPAGWYLASGTAVLAIAGREGIPAPWMMGVPFGLGQLFVAWILHRAGGEAR